MSIREPTFEQLDAYLQQTAIRIYNPYFSDSDSSYEVFVWNEIAESEEFFLNPQTQMLFEDVNGDSESDLVMVFADPNSWGWEYIIIMLWQAGAYSQPLIVMEGSKLPGEMHYALEDWTGDGIGEIVWRVANGTSGSGIYETTRKLYLIQCLSACNVIWEYKTSIDWSAYHQYFERRIQATEVIRMEENSPKIIATTEDFVVPFIEEETTSPLRVYTTTQEVYLWSGSAFELSESSVLTPAYRISSTHHVDQEPEIGFVALETSYVPSVSGSSEFSSYDCAVKVNAAVIGVPFKCTPTFTKIWWQDVTADGEKELVVSTLFEAKGYMFIWRWVNGQYSLIADIYGDVIRPNLYGVILKNIDTDPELEILAGEWGYETNSFCFSRDELDGVQCWFEVTRADILYNWDGLQFVVQPKQ